MTPNRVRIIGGQWRSRVLQFPAEEGLRPTADRVRETLFNWLGQTLDGKDCLDLFAGSGALGLEAGSRGAAHVTLVEQSRKVFVALQQNVGKLSAQNVEVVCDDALHYLTQTSRCFDVVFLDPPFHKEFLPLLWPLLETRLNPGGKVYAESEKPFEPVDGWRVYRSGRAGKVHYCLLMGAHDA